MLEQAEQRLTERGYINVEFVLQSASDLNYDDYFDYVLSTNAFHHFADKQDVFARVYKSLRNGLIIAVGLYLIFLLRRCLGQRHQWSGGKDSQ